MTTKILSYIGLALLLVVCNLQTAPKNNKTQTKNQKTAQKITKQDIAKTPSTEAKDAFVIMGAYKAMVEKNKPLTFETTLVAERSIQPTKLVYTIKTQKFEPRTARPNPKIKPTEIKST